MKRILSILLAVAMIAGLSTAVYAQDDLVSFSGTMRVLGFYDENYTDFDSSLDVDKNAYWWQRFRLYSKFTPAEGVSAHLRTDFSERDWGSGNGGNVFGRPAEGFQTLHVDRAFLEIAKEMFSFRAGQQYTRWGVTAAVDPQFTGYLLNLKFPVTVDLLYGKVDENTGVFNLSDEEEDLDDDGTNDFDSEDETFYGLQVGYASETFTVKGFYVQRDDDTALNQDDSINVFGIWTQMNFGMFDLAAELDVFGGDNDDPTPGAEIDYEGTQFYLGVGMKFSDAFRLGVDFVFAEGTDDGVSGVPGETADNADEVQVVEVISAFGDFVPQSLPMLDADYYIIGEIFEPWENAGVIGLIIEAEMAATDALKFYGQMGYAQAEEEDIRGADYEKLWDDTWWVQAGLQWNFMEAASFIFVGHYTQYSFDGDDDHPLNEAVDDGDVEDDGAWGVITEIRVTF